MRIKLFRLIYNQTYWFIEHFAAGTPDRTATSVTLVAFDTAYAKLLTAIIARAL